MAEEKIYFDEGDVKVTIIGIIGLVCFAFQWILAIILLAGAVLLWIMQKNKFVISLSSASGSEEALTSKDEAYIDRIVNALNDAIAERG